MIDILLLAGVALCVLSVLMAIVSVARTQAPRGAAILLVLGLAMLLAGGWLDQRPFGVQSLQESWQRLVNGQVTTGTDPVTAPAPEAPAEEAPAETPAADAPATPAVEAPAAEPPAVEAPEADAPEAAAPAAEEPVAAEPAAAEPAAEEPAAEAPAADAAAPDAGEGEAQAEGQ
ncbi:hypothetical protein EQ718_08280 [Paracoccus versutus]|uniref:Uncharacterized protein n=1 Tax=Paracoccus versutus TaxID=34007 RepID=A0AAQ0HJT9_PARVE|nr:hypothetical protein [Paracoccus versutus]KGJ11369.1 hypothetical protein IT40_07305 [Paracoccus versutus]REG53181.1 hypothetical protein ATH84_100778 [Paracoccus versutus]WEJ78878.1 hypothetical protein EQ718_08280 [Paracoccus versutus]